MFLVVQWIVIPAFVALGDAALNRTKHPCGALDGISSLLLALELVLFIDNGRLVPGVKGGIGLQVGDRPAASYHQWFPTGHLQRPVQLRVPRLAVVPGYCVHFSKTCLEVEVLVLQLVVLNGPFRIFLAEIFTVGECQHVARWSLGLKMASSIMG